MRDLIVHEWIEKSGGSEVVLDQMVEALPDADILCLWKDDAERYPGRRVTESWIARTPLRRSKMLALPVMPTTWARTDTSEYDRVLVSSHLFAHQVGGTSKKRRADKTFVYVHTPARYVWTPELDKRGDGLIVKAAAAVLKPYDRRTAHNSTALAANSEFVRERIARSWQRDSVVIYPPVNVAQIADNPAWSSQLSSADQKIFDTLPSEFVLGASRFVPYKELELVIAAGEAADLPVVLAGDGPERANLEAIGQAARVPVHFVGRPSNALLYTLYQAATVYVFPGIEDFGIMPVEAMAAGARVLVGSTGGATESVIDGTTGVHVDDWTGRTLADAVSAAASMSREDSRRRAWEFDSRRFREQYNRLDRSELMGRRRRITVNGSFRPQTVSGQQRYAREISDRIAAEKVGTETAPGSWFAASGLRTWAWVLAVLPIRAARIVLLTLTSRGPVIHPRQVVVVHDIFVLTNPEWYSKKYVLSHAPLLRAQLRTAKAVVAVSEPVARQVERAGLTKAPIVVAPNAPSTQFSPSADGAMDALPDRFALTPDSYLLVVGSLDPRKNFERLAAAYSHLPAELRATLPLVVVGGVNASVFGSVGITWPDEAIMAGYVTDAELAVLYRSARGVVFPSLAEGFGLPIVEAAVSGARLAVSDIEVFRWIAGDAVTYFDPTSVDDIASALGQLATASGPVDPAFATSVSERFDWNRSAATIIEACLQVSRR